MIDPFMFQALKHLDDLRALLLDRNRRFSNRALDQAADDIAAVAIRVLRGRKCAGPHCEADAIVEPILTESYCSSFCRGASVADVIDTQNRIQEAMEPYDDASQ